MANDPGHLPTEPETEISTLLPVAERMRLEAIEEYRHELRRRLEAKDAKSKEHSQFWLEKVVAPGLIVALTAGFGGYLAPRILAASQDARRDAETRAKVIEEIAQTTAEVQAAIDGQAAAIDTYWSDAARINSVLGEFALRRDLGQMTSMEFERQNTLLETDRKRVSDRYESASADYQRQLKAFRPWLRRTRARLTIFYGRGEHRVAVEQSLASLNQSVTACDAALLRKDKLYDEALIEDIQQVKNLRAKFRAREIPQDEYRSRTAAILDRLRVLTIIDGPAHVIDESAISAILETIRSTPTDLAL